LISADFLTRSTRRYAVKIRALYATAVFGFTIGLITVPAHAQSVDPCTVYMCMAGISGSGASGGPGCAPALAFWDAPTPGGLAVYDEIGFDPFSSYAVRQTYLMTCPGANALSNAAILQAIMLEWGYSETF
jgi:hypothetical protein